MPTDNIELLQPQSYDLVDRTIMIAGNAVGFEGHLSIRVTDGHKEHNAGASVGSFALRQFQATIEIPENDEFQLSRLFLRLADDSAVEDGPSVTVPIIYGPKILPNYFGYRIYTVQPGDTLTSIAQSELGNGNFQPIVGANQNIIDDPNLIFIGQELRIPITV